jgi:NAD(P)H-flavin reductase
MAGAPARDPFVPQVYRVARVQRELPDTATLELMPLAGRRPDFVPGQFNMLYAFGIGEVAISISGSSADPSAFVHTVRDVGAVSGAIARLEEGATLGLRGPYGRGWPIAAAEGADVLFVAGGLGLAPLRPAILGVLAHRRRYGRIGVLVGSRHPRDLLYRQELETWRQRADVDVEVCVDHADADWTGHVGVVTTLVPRAVLDPNVTIAMICGPELMMRFTVSALRAAGVATDRIHVSMERNMKCAIGLCGHCQFGPSFICKDGPVMRYDAIAGLLAIAEI